MRKTRISRKSPGGKGNAEKILTVRVDPEFHTLLVERASVYGFSNVSAYLRELMKNDVIPEEKISQKGATMKEKENDKLVAVFEKQLNYYKKALMEIQMIRENMSQEDDVQSRVARSLSVLISTSQSMRRTVLEYCKAKGFNPPDFD